MNEHSRTPVLLTIATLIVVSLISWYAVRRSDAPSETERSGESTASLPPVADSHSAELAAISVAPITLPNFEPTIPPGENRDVVMANCVLCHSLRLVINQPAFPREQWEATVQKMVDVFGAPIPDDAKGKAVDYLVSIRGTENGTND